MFCFSWNTYGWNIERKLVLKRWLARMHAYIRLHYCVIQLLYASYVHNNMIAVETRIVCVYTGLYAQMIAQKKNKKIQSAQLIYYFIIASHLSYTLRFHWNLRPLGKVKNKHLGNRKKKSISNSKPSFPWYTRLCS